MTHVDDSTTPPVNHTMSRRRFLQMGTLVAALGCVGSTALAGNRYGTKSAQAASRLQREKTTRAAARPVRFTSTEKPVRSERRATSGAQQRRA